MLWQVRALLADRPGAMAALASRCGARGANILALDVHPTTDGQVVDELVVHAPADWGIGDVEQLCCDAGVADCVVTECSAQALEDQPVRYLRAAQTVLQRPDKLEDVLCRLLDAEPVHDVGSATLLLDDDRGPLVALGRERAFTAMEEARAAELRTVAATALDLDPRPRPARLPGEVGPGPAVGRGTPGAGPEPGALRSGTVADTRALVEMHERCGAATLQQRYHSPMRHLSPRLAQAMLAPTDGFSVVVTGPDRHSVVGFGMVASGAEVVEAAVLVEDAWQRRGLGAKLLTALAEEAARNGARELTLLTRRDNTSVLSTVHRAGLRALVGTSDGLTRIRVPLRSLVDAPRTPGRPSRGRITQPLVALLHERRELREIYGPADFIDRAVRENV